MDPSKLNIHDLIRGREQLRPPAPPPAPVAGTGHRPRTGSSLEAPDTSQGAQEVPFDKLDALDKDSVQLDEEWLEFTKGEEGEAPAPPVKAPSEDLHVRSFDFRHRKMPEGAQVINGEGHLEEQQDKSTALQIPPNASLVCSLGVPPNNIGRFVNDYTLTFDIKLDSLPADSLSLYQANPGVKPTEGETYITKTGGVGIFGEYGVSDAWVKEKKWTRVVITVGAPSSAGASSLDMITSSRRMYTYVNGKLCATVDKGVLQTLDGRFAVSTDSIVLFGSTRDDLMPGLRIKYFEFRPSVLSPEQVKESTNLNRIYSYWEVEKEQEERRKFENLSLQSLYKRPPPVWIHPAFLGEFGDAFLEGTGLEGGSLYPSLAVFSLALDQAFKDQRDYLNTLEHTDLQSLEAINQSLKEAKDLARKFELASRNGSQLVHFMRGFSKIVKNLKEGEHMLVPGGVAKHHLMYILERQASSFRFVIVNTSPYMGLAYHQASAQKPHKIMYKTCMALDNVSPHRVYDDAFWAMLFKLIVYPSDFNTPDKIYDLLLPFLVEKPLEAALVETQDDLAVDWRSPQRASTAYYRAVLESFHYLMRQKGLTQKKAKLVSFVIRLQMVSMVDNDLRFVSSINLSDTRLVKMACEQLAYTSAKLSTSDTPDSLTVVQLADIKSRVDAIDKLVEELPCDDTYSTAAPPALELDDGSPPNYQWGMQPFYERLLRTEDVDGLAGLPVRLPKYVPVDMLQLPARADTFEEALAAIRYCDKMCTLISVQSHTIKNTEFLKCALLQHTFTQVVPVPQGLNSKDSKPCIWAISLRYALQLDILVLLQRLIEHFASSAFAIKATRSFDAVRIIVPACMAAIADVVIRKRATDIPSELSLHLMGDGARFGYGLSVGKFGEQSETIEVHAPELNIARTAVLDYFAAQRDIIPSSHQIFCWENGNGFEQNTNRFLGEVCEELAFPQNDIHAYISGEQPLILKNYPEFLCYRDVAYYFKYFMNTEDEAFPRPALYTQQHAQLAWKMGDGEYFIIAYGQFLLHCRPKKKPFTHRFPSVATPSFLTTPHPVETEDDVLHIKNLPSFEEALGQRDAELLISYLTVPYMRLPLVMTFFSTEDRIHSLKSKQLQEVLDSVLFEPGRYLPAWLNKEPHDVPTSEPELLATPYGMLINELHRSPAGLIDSTLKLLRFALDLDTGSAHSSTVDIILYVMRVAIRVNNYLTFMISHTLGKHECISSTLRDVTVTPSILSILENGQRDLQALLFGPVHRLLEGWCYQVMKACEGKSDDKIVDENTRIACTMHAHLLLLYRNVPLSELSEAIVSTLLCAFIFLTTRHTWNMLLLPVPETEVYELLQVQRRKLINWTRQAGQRPLNEIMEGVVRVSTGTGIRTADPAAQKAHFVRRWAFIAGDRSVGRFTVASSRDHSDDKSMERRAVEIVGNEHELGVEIDTQTIQLTLKSSHLKALSKAIAGRPDVLEIFGSHSMQAATIETTEHRDSVRLIGREHDLHFWKTPDPRMDIQINDRDYVPGELEESEQWIIPIFEPVRMAYLMQPFPLQVCLPERALPADAEVAYMVGIHPKLGGTWKEIFVFRTLRLVQIYNVMSHGRRFYRSLEYTTDVHFTLRDMQPSTDDRKYPWPKWERHGAGHPYAQYPDPTSVVIFRDATHPSNLSGTQEQFIPSRLLYGTVPSALLDTHQFWQDKEDNLLGYPTNNAPHVIVVELVKTDKIVATQQPGYCGRIFRVPVLDFKKRKGLFGSQVAEEEATKAQERPRDRLKKSFSKTEETRKEKTLEEEELLFLNLLYAPKGTKLHSLAKVLARIEKISYILAWTKQLNSSSDNFNIDLIEMPRLKMAFKANLDNDGVTRLYSIDHVNLFITNTRSDLTTRLIRGIPHSLLLSDSNGEIQILVPSIHPMRPFIAAAPFSTELVLDRTDTDWHEALDTKYYLYPVHVSLSFMFTPTLSSALYLLLLRFLHRDYDQVFRLASTIGTDTNFSPEESNIFKALGESNNDCHPNAHASRLKISSVTIDSPVECPWDITKQMSRYVTKLPHVGVTCHLSHTEELQLLQEQCICDVTDGRFDPKIYSVYEITLVKNFRAYLQARESGSATSPCYLVPRSVDSGWPYTNNLSALGASASSWQSLSLTYAAPRVMSGVMVMDIADQFWPGSETTFGSELKLGFLFLYGLFTGSIKCKVLSNDDGHSLATILLQLIADKSDNSVLASILNILSHNPALCKRLPQFNDNRKMKNETINGWLDENETVSPLDDLLSMLIPQLMSAMEESDMILPPEEWGHLREPQNTVPVAPETERSWVLPVLSNFLCEERTLNAIDIHGHEALKMDPQTQQAFAAAPLATIEIEKYVLYMTREQMGRGPVSSEVPFDVSQHSQAKSAVALSMVARLENDMKTYAEQQNDGQTAKCVHLLDQDIEKYVLKNSEDASACLDKAIDHLQQLTESLLKLRDADSQYVTQAIPFVTETSNRVQLPSTETGEKGKEKGESDNSELREKLRFILKRYCGQETNIWLDYVVGALLSSEWKYDIQKLNPYFAETDIKQTFDVITGIILHANRIGHINRCLSDARDILGLLRVAKAEGGRPNPTLFAGLLQKGESLATNLATKRHYIDKGDDQWKYDPRFLVFEFTWNIMLRRSQVLLVREFISNLKMGKSMVRQMIMGAGKTTVVGPLLCLMLGDGKSLVAQVVPPALLEFSRSIMRSTFSSIMHKRIYTLHCDRASKVDRRLYNKLVNAIKTKGVLISTPTSIKSMMLKLVETLHLIEDESGPRHPQMERDAAELANVISLFRDGVLIMDEVDLILHPLKSELNFPIGPKLDLDFHPLRWKLPIHLLDAIFYAERGTMSVGFRESNRAVAILEKLKVTINTGYQHRAMQRNPHIVLLNPSFYHKHLKPLIAEWAVLWLETQNLTGLTDSEIKDYIMEESRTGFATRKPELAAKVNAHLSPKHKKMLNLCRDWLKSYLPHVLQKIDRVSFGLLSKSDYERAIAADPHMPRTRAKLAVPFVGKDVPSQSSEFAHPDVIIGLTILAYRYEGLRWTDFVDIVSSLRSTLTLELGPFNERKSSIRYANWVKEAGGHVKGSRNYAAANEKGKDIAPMELDAEDDANEVVPLRLLKRSNEEQMNKLFQMLFKLPDLIHWYLNEFIFPAYMRHQVVKLSESGQALGGDMLFGRRIGFSGTPSDLMPIELGVCGYEKGSDGLILNYLTDPAIVSQEIIEEGWTVKSLLNEIARANPPYHALIDTGALITGMTNYEVAAYLLAHGLQNFEGVVFLDELDRKMILVRATGRVLKLAQCGIPDKKRFAFYDQVHTTGMDIKHVLNACAVLTLGKDMTFRDYAQGAFRMRGIGRGQTIHLFVIPEIERLMARELKEACLPNKGLEPERKPLVDVAAWLVINSMRSERIQFNQLCLQNVTNVWRKNAFKTLLKNHKQFSISAKLEDPVLRRSIQVFREAIDFSLEAGVPVPTAFDESITNRIGANTSLIETEAEWAIINHVRELVSMQKSKQGKEKKKDQQLTPEEVERKKKMRRRRLMNSEGMFFDAEKVQEQEQEREQQQEQEQEQEIEIEKYVDLAYSRDHEAPIPWPFSTLRNRGAVPQFYPANQFHLYKRPPLAFEDYLLVSNNYFNKEWSGARRIKNVVMVLEWIPSTSSLKLKPARPSDAVNTTQEVALRKAFSLFDQDNNGHLNEHDMTQVIRSAIDFMGAPPPERVADITKEFGSKDGVNYENLKQFLQSGRFREEEDGRYYVTVSLAEAETIRRIMHMRLERNIIDGTDTAMALRCVAADNMAIDVSHSFKPAGQYQTEVAYQSLRFLNCDMYFKPEQLSVLLRAMQRSTIRERIVFFERIIGCRRRMNRKWEDTPLAKFCSLPDEFHLLKQLAQSVRIREAIKAKGLLLYDAFRLFDSARNGFLTAPELWGAMDWLGIAASAEDILDFMRTADANHDGNVDYREFLDMVRDPDAKLDDSEDGDSAQDGSITTTLLEFFETPPKPKGEEELKQLMEKQLTETKAQEEGELQKEREFEQKIRREIREEEEEADRKQEGGPNPKIIGDGFIRYDFTTGRRPRDMTCRGDIAYKSEYGTAQYLKVYKQSVLFLPIPFVPPADHIGKRFNQYTVTMQVMLDELPAQPAMTALFSTGVYNEKPADVYVRWDGKIGTGQVFGEAGNETVSSGKWQMISISVDCLVGMMNIFIDGRIAAVIATEDIAVIDGILAVSNQICLFGSKKVEETRGANIKALWFDSRAYSQSDAQALFDNVQYEHSWECPQCTLRNPPSVIECSTCGYFNVAAGAASVSSDMWICSQCTFKNPASEVSCSMCGSSHV
eukprot:TRINITY_DN1482_c0_g1_i1.p1 TRINITY_DN1482_c0_g1~~TRINITY_DN1482_c0_g1_i1.p1  ORF type:complete len:4317 (-),score=602.49 TRINITY_DN1482_c0_g1_i1:51-13001(-)